MPISGQKCTSQEPEKKNNDAKAKVPKIPRLDRELNTEEYPKFATKMIAREIDDGQNQIELKNEESTPATKISQEEEDKKDSGAIFRTNSVIQDIGLYAAGTETINSKRKVKYNLLYDTGECSSVTVEQVMSDTDNFVTV